MRQKPKIWCFSLSVLLLHLVIWHLSVLFGGDWNWLSKEAKIRNKPEYVKCMTTDKMERRNNREEFKINYKFYKVFKLKYVETTWAYMKITTEDQRLTRPNFLVVVSVGSSSTLGCQGVTKRSHLLPLESKRPCLIPRYDLVLAYCLAKSVPKISVWLSLFAFFE